MKTTIKNKWQSTKWQLTLLVIFCATILAGFRVLSGLEWVITVTCLSIAYMIGNITSATLLNGIGLQGTPDEK